MLNKVYEGQALGLTMAENWRTDGDYSNNLIAKLALFKFVNTFSSVFFTAFFKKVMGGCIEQPGFCQGEGRAVLNGTFVADEETQSPSWAPTMDPFTQTNDCLGELSDQVRPRAVLLPRRVRFSVRGTIVEPRASPGVWGGFRSRRDERDDGGGAGCEVRAPFVCGRCVGGASSTRDRGEGWGVGKGSRTRRCPATPFGRRRTTPRSGFEFGFGRSRGHARPRAPRSQTTTATTMVINVVLTAKPNQQPGRRRGDGALSDGGGVELRHGACPAAAQEEEDPGQDGWRLRGRRPAALGVPPPVRRDVRVRQHRGVDQRCARVTRISRSFFSRRAHRQPRAPAPPSLREWTCVLPLATRPSPQPLSRLFWAWI